MIYGGWRYPTQVSNFIYKKRVEINKPDCFKFSDFGFYLFFRNLCKKGKPAKNRWFSVKTFHYKLRFAFFFLIKSGAFRTPFEDFHFLFLVL